MKNSSTSTPDELELGKMKKAFLYIGLCSLLFSCNTYQKQQRKFIKFASDYPSELARLCSDRFPTTPIFIKGKTDTIHPAPIIIRDTVDCPDGTKVPIERKVDCPPSTHSVDTLRLPDNAKIFLLNKTIQDLQLSIEGLNKKFTDSIKVKDDKIKDLQSEIRKKDKKLLYRLWIIIGLSGIIGLATFLRIKGII